jgi:hypothetical protein
MAIRCDVRLKRAKERADKPPQLVWLLRFGGVAFGPSRQFAAMQNLVAIGA